MNNDVGCGIYDTNLNLLISFDTYIENTYSQKNAVAYEPLENGSFSSDSKQNSPFLVSITGIIIIHNAANVLITGNFKTVDQIEQQLLNLSNGTQLVSVILQPMVEQNKQKKSNWFQYGKFYENMSLVAVEYANSPEQLEFRATMTFQQIRLTNSQYTSTQYTADPQLTPSTNQGQVQPSANTQGLPKSAAGGL